MSCSSNILVLSWLKVVLLHRWWLWISSPMHTFSEWWLWDMGNGPHFQSLVVGRYCQMPVLCSGIDKRTFVLQVWRRGPNQKRHLQRCCLTIQEAALEPLKNGNEFPWSKLQGNPAVINVIWFAVFLEDGHNYDIWISLTYPPLPRYEWWTFLLPNCRTSAQLLFVCEVSVCSWYKACSTSWQSRVAKLNWIDAVSKVGVP